MKRISIIIVLALLVSACATKPMYVGTVVDCQGKPISGAEVEIWKNRWIPFHLPSKLGETKTDKSGGFVLKAEKRASFFVYSGGKLILTSHPNKSESKCASSGT